MAYSADPDQLLYTVCKSRVYLGSAGQELTEAMHLFACLFVCAEVLRPSQPNGVVERGQFT